MQTWAVGIFIIAGLCKGQPSEIFITSKKNGDPPYKFEFRSDGLSKFVRNEKRIVSPESAFAHPNDYKRFLNQRYGNLLIDSFNIQARKFDSLSSALSKIQINSARKIPPDTSSGVFFEVRKSSKDSLRYIGKLGDSPIFSDLICRIFNDTDQATPVGMLPYFQEEFGVRCDSTLE